MAERFNEQTDPSWNREPGIVVIPGSNYAKEMEKFEQFPSKYGNNPGNPYTYRPFPKMVYRAELYKGKPLCMASQPEPLEFSNQDEFRRAEEMAKKFTERCQLIVNDDRELQKAFENGYREGPAEAVEYLERRLRSEANEAAERNYRDRNMSEKAKAEATQASQEHFSEEGRHLPAVPEKPIKRSRSEIMKENWAKRKAKAAEQT